MNLYVWDNADGWVCISDSVIAKLHSYDGTGMADTHAITERGPLQHGETYIDYRLDARTVQLVMGIQSDSWAGVETLLNRLYLLLKPGQTVTLLKFVTDGGYSRVLEGSFSSPLFGGREASGAQYYQRLSVTFKAPDPTFYDPTGDNYTVDLGGGTSTCAIPTAIPTNIGMSTVSQNATVSNPGTFVSYPTIRVTGPITNPIVQNTTTGETLSFTGTTIAAGDYYDIDCRYGYKTVKDASAVSQISDLTTDSDLATFHIAAHPEALGGNNNILVTGSSVNSASGVSVNYFRRYVGI